ncbi:F1F0 ATP synthase subunit 4 [Sugiyamaella lignohabitans]|uniref:ATP synthase subunit 4 n=1 Tax=Sugiyamaella lignohabitans TaxID=796027 RepID=A0A167D550_9ASCO|nr:F1F0 ATP synthase subunit 4 [Sugiyamaella lignohabitans]ANB12494.1 F1F0 ATP synthase subunit 4 [Sugiyamaella lignohabitans]
MRPLAARPVMGLALRGYASQVDPKTKAQAIIDALPGSNLISKTGILATSSAAAIYAVSNSLYVVNAETCLLVVFGAFLYVMSKTAAPAYKDWAEGHISTIRGALDKAREGHVVAVKERIESVNQLKDVVATTKDLFALSKETVELEAKAFEAKQKVEFAHEAKSVLDSWVRYEGQVRQREQKELAEAVIAKIEKEVSTKKFQQSVLNQAVADIEQLFAKKA